MAPTSQAITQAAGGATSVKGYAGSKKLTVLVGGRKIVTNNVQVAT